VTWEQALEELSITELYRLVEYHLAFGGQVPVDVINKLAEAGFIVELMQ
jgi:hypothetical protein